jgi:hypothetical protein
MQRKIYVRYVHLVSIKMIKMNNRFLVQEIARARKADLAAISLRTQQKEDLIKAVILKEQEKWKLPKLV